MTDDFEKRRVAAPHSPRPAHQQTIGINAHLLSGEAGYRRAGIHHYIAQVLRHLPAADELRYVYYTRHTPDEPRPDARVVGSRLPTERRAARILWEQLVWPWRAKRDKLDLLHSMAFAMPRLAPCPAVVTIYDLSFLRYPDVFPAMQRRYLAAETARACRHARRLIAISESGRRDLQELCGVPPERVDVVTPGVDACYGPRPAGDVAAFRRDHDLPDRFLLHVGTLQPRKNIPVLLDALAQMGGNTLLVLIGGKGWLYDDIFAQVSALGLEEQVRYVGYVDDAELPLWYNAATALVMPSLYEGFGLPIVEVLACGTPVVAANTSSLPEAGGEAALYFDPRDSDELAGCLAQLLGDDALRERLRRVGPAQAARFSWSRAGEATAAVYRRALNLDATDAL